MKTLTVLAFAAIILVIGVAAAILGLVHQTPATVLDGLQIAALGVLFIYLSTRE